MEAMRDFFLSISKVVLMLIIMAGSGTLILLGYLVLGGVIKTGFIYDYFYQLMLLGLAVASFSLWLSSRRSVTE